MNHEDYEQIAVFDWARMAECTYPQLHWLYHVPNERKCSVQQGALLKRKGVKSGVPDIFLDYPVNGYHGLRIELKYGKNKPSESQREWIQMYRQNGYYACVCYGAEMAIDVIEAYVKGVFK